MNTLPNGGKAIDHFAFVGSYTGFKPGELGWVGSVNPGKGITSFLFNDLTGKLLPTGKITEQESPTWLEICPNKKFLIATHELSQYTGVSVGVGYVTSYKIGSDGSLTEVNTQSTGGLGNTCATFDRTGKFLLVTRYWEGGFTVLPFDPETGIISKMTAKQDYEGRGPVPLRQTQSHPHGVKGDPWTDTIYVMDLGTDEIHQHRLDTKTGKLLNRKDVKVRPGNGPRGISFHPFLRVAYVNCELGGTIIVCKIDEDRGLIPVQYVNGYPKGFSAIGKPANFGRSDFWGAEGCLSADGSFYYFICRVHQSIAVFSIGNEDGELSFSGRYSLSARSNARNLTLDPTGKYLLVASQDADCVECFQIEPKIGSLKLVCRQDSPCAADVAVI